MVIEASFTGLDNTLYKNLRLNFTRYLWSSSNTNTSIGWTVKHVPLKVVSSSRSPNASIEGHHFVVFWIQADRLSHTIGQISIACLTQDGRIAVVSEEGCDWWIGRWFIQGPQMEQGANNRCVITVAGQTVLTRHYNRSVRRLSSPYIYWITSQYCRISQSYYGHFPRSPFATLGQAGLQIWFWYSQFWQPYHPLYGALA